MRSKQIQPSILIHPCRYNYCFSIFCTSNNHLKTGYKLKIPTWTHSYCNSNTIILLSTVKILKHWSIVNFKISKFTHNHFICLPVGGVRCMAPEFLHSKGNHIRFMKMLFRKTFITLRHGAFYPLMSFRLQIAYRKVRSLQIGIKVKGYHKISDAHMIFHRRISYCSLVHCYLAW